MLKTRRSSIVSIATITAMAILIPGCQLNEGLQGRLILINSTGAVIRGVKISVPDTPPHPHVDTIEFHDLADGHAEILFTSGGNPIPIVRAIELSWTEKDGTKHSRSIPLEGTVPDPCEDDFFMEIGGSKEVRSGLLEYRKYQGYDSSAIKTHALAGASGLLIGWLIWRKR